LSAAGDGKVIGGVGWIGEVDGLVVGVAVLEGGNGEAGVGGDVEAACGGVGVVGVVGGPDGVVVPSVLPGVREDALVACSLVGGAEVGVGVVGVGDVNGDEVNAGLVVSDGGIDGDVEAEADGLWACGGC
jgi:hypothetical protein